MGFFNRKSSGGKSAPDPQGLEREIEKARNALAHVTAAHDAAWHLGQANWNLDQDIGDLVFITPQGMTAVAPAQVIGTYNTVDGTWLWAWDHPWIEPPLAKDAKAVLAYGQQDGHAMLTTRKLQCTEDEAWGLTALAFMLCKANGAYRGPAGTALVFMTFGEVKLSKTS